MKVIFKILLTSTAKDYNFTNPFWRRIMKFTRYFIIGLSLMITASYADFPLDPGATNQILKVDSSGNVVWTTDETASGNYLTSGNSVTDLSDVTSVGSGQIITAAERTSLGTFLTTGNISGFGSGNVITDSERTSLGTFLTSGNSVTDLSDISSAGSGNIITQTERDNLTTLSANISTFLTSGNSISVTEGNFTGNVNTDGYIKIKEGAAPSNEAGYGKVYTSSDNNLYYITDGGNVHRINNAPTSHQIENLENVTSLTSMTANQLYGTMTMPLTDVTVDAMELYTEDSTSSLIEVAVYDSSFNLLGSGNATTTSTGFIQVSLSSAVNLTSGVKYHFVMSTSVARKFADVNLMFGYMKVKTFRWVVTSTGTPPATINFASDAIKGGNKFWMRTVDN